MSCSSSSSGSGSGSEEDEGTEAYRKGGYHAVRVGDQFSAGRYVAQRKLGWGNFSTVWLAYDTQLKRFVALKIQKSAPEFAQAASHEIEFLSAITLHDPQNRRCILQLLDHFKHAGPNGQHLCLVFEFLGDSLLRLIRFNRYEPLPLILVRRICRDVLIGLDYLHQLGIIHTDLKPENVLLISPIDPSKDPIKSNFQPILDRPTNPNSASSATVNKIEKRLKEHAKAKLARISKQRPSMAARPARKKERELDKLDLRCKIVDFGNACWEERKFGEVIQTRQYRAPEVVLGTGYGCAADMWSFACVAYELATGDVLFCPKEGNGFSEDEDHLALMMELLGKMPKKIAVSGAMSKDYFDRHGDLKRIRRLGFRPLDRVLIDRFKFTEIDALEFMNFLSPLLDFDPAKRPTAAQCLSHPWLQIHDINQENNENKGSNNESNNKGRESSSSSNKGKENVKNDAGAGACSSTSGGGLHRNKEKESVAVVRSNSGNSRSKSEIIGKFNNKVHNREENDEKEKGEKIVNEKEKKKGGKIVNEKEKNKGEKDLSEKEKSKGEKVASSEGENSAMVKRVASRFNEKINQNKINNNIILTRSKTTRNTDSNPPVYNNATENNNSTANNPTHHVNNTNNINNITRNINENIVNNNNNNTVERQSNNNEPVGRVAIAMSKLGVSGRINSRRIG